MPSALHELLANLIPRIRAVSEIETVEAERAKLAAKNSGRQEFGEAHELPTRVVPFFHRRFVVSQTRVGAFGAHVISRRGRAPRRTVFLVHGGGFTGPIDPFHVRYAARLARGLDARVVIPDYPLAPEHTWRDSYDALVASAGAWAAAGPMILAGDSAGGGLALAVALALRDAGGAQPTSLLLISPWVDLTTSTPETAEFSARDPWLRLTKIHAWALFWAGHEQDLGRPEVSPGLADLSGLPRALMFCGTRDSLAPGCRLLARRAAQAGWDLTYVEEPGLIHVYPMLPFLPEARRAFRQTLAFLG
ncbi:alpha/beta hydrolase [Nocardioides sp.]|uniref:alpha/beta hydrolase n=1 Tax=Nocardioides sp. TaxID=35761 RepID=UPI003D0C8D4E